MWASCSQGRQVNSCLEVGEESSPEEAGRRTACERGGGGDSSQTLWVRRSRLRRVGARGLQGPAPEPPGWDHLAAKDTEEQKALSPPPWCPLAWGEVGKPLRCAQLSRGGLWGHSAPRGVNRCFCGTCHPARLRAGLHLPASKGRSSPARQEPLPGTVFRNVGSKPRPDPHLQHLSWMDLSIPLSQPWGAQGTGGSTWPAESIPSPITSPGHPGSGD